MSSQPESLPDHDSSQEIVEKEWQPPCQSLWDEIEACFVKLGKRPMMKLMANLDSSIEYRKWLSRELKMPYTTDRCEFVSTAEACGDITLTKLSADPSRQHGYRVVSAAGLVKKMRDLTIAGEWRSWDSAQLCVVTPATEEPPAKKAKSETEEQHIELVYMDFHHRACALHGLRIQHGIA